MKATMRKNKGNIFIVSAPSGAGKTTICQKLTELFPDIRHSISYTTRLQRNGEVNDRDYTFVNESEFLKMAEAGEFVEWAKVHGNLYGTSKRRLKEMMDQGISVVLDIDTQGAKQIRGCYDDGVYIFILPPSIETLRERLEKRMSNSPDEIELRMKRAADEIREYKNYDYVIVNNDIEKALEELEAIVTAESKKTDKIDHQLIREKFKL